MANEKQIFMFEPDYAVPPGDTLIELIESLGITQVDLAKRTGRPQKTINGIIKGKVEITAETALQFEKVLGMPAKFWLNLEYNYQEAKARITQKEQLIKDIDWLKEIPYKEMVKYNWIKACKSEVEYIHELLNYFGTASVKAWKEQWVNPEAIFRKSKAFETYPGAAAAWLRKGEIEAQKIDCDDYNKTNFKQTLKKIRNLTVNLSDGFEKKLINYCSSAGVALVFVRELPKCPVSGATKWLTPNKAIIQMTLRYKTDDHFWFTFFHEAGHLLLHGKKEVFIHDGNNKDHKEHEADTFASNFLISEQKYKQFVQTKRFNEASILNFARDEGISPGIVVGRLQHDELIPFSYHNKLKKRIIWAS